MSDWRHIWPALAPREQWLASAVGLALLGMLYVWLLADPLSQRVAAQDTRLRQAESRVSAADGALRALDARLAEDPNLRYRQALQAAQDSREQILARIDAQTASLVSPTRMQALLQDLLRAQPRLTLLGLESFSLPLQPPPASVEAVPPAAGQLPGVPLPPAQLANVTPSAPSSAPVFYRHGLRLSLEGGYFELLAYLRAIQASGWRLHWDSLDYQVGEQGPGRARISIELHTLSRHAGWVGV